MGLRTVGVKLVADVSNYTSNMHKATQSTKSFSEGLGDKAAKGKLDAIADRAGVVGLAVGAGFALAVKSAAEFDKQMSSVKAATHASAGEMEKLRAAAIKAGADTQYSATEAAKGIEELAKAGVSTTDILNGGLNGALSLAAAGQMDVGAAAEAAASALTQFKLKGQDVPHVADLLAAAAGKAQGEVSDMSAALNQAGLIASQTGLSIEDTTGTLAAFASAGLLGSDAGTSFKTMLQAVQAPSGKTKELMDDLGISAYDTAGNFIGITKFAGQLKEQLGKLTPELRANALAQIFGSDATRAASILYEQGSTGIQTWIDKTNDAGYAAETAAIKTDNLAGDIERLKGSLDTLLIQSGGGAQTGLRAITKSLEKMVEQFSKLPSGVTATITVMAGLTAAVLVGGAAWVKIRSAIASTVAELNAVGPAGAKAATGLQAVTKWGGYAAIAFAGLEVAGAVFDEMGNAATNVNKLTASLQDFATTGKMSQGLTDTFGEDLQFLGKNAHSAEMATHGFWGAWNDFTSSIPGIRSALDTLNEWTWGTSMNDSTERMKALDESFTAFIGTQKDAKKAGELWNEILLKSGLDTEQLQALLPNTTAAMVELQKAAHGGAGAQDKLATSTGKTKEQLEQEAEAAKAVEQAFDDLFDKYMSADQAAIQYEKSLTATNKELKDGAKKLDLNSEAGQKNRAAMLDHIKTIKEQREANINNGMSVEEADKKYRSQIGTLKKNATNLGFNKTKVGELVDKYADIPDKVSTKVEQPGISTATTKTDHLWEALKGVDGNWVANIRTTGYGKTAAELRHLLAAQRAAKDGISVNEANRELGHFFAHGGPVVGPGSGTSDSIAARLSNGEHVWTAAEVAAAGGQQAVASLRSAAKTGKRIGVTETTPGFAAGGPVNMPFPYTTKYTKIPEPPVPTGGRTSDWIVATVKARFPGIDVYSKDRPGARTLSGNVSYHARGRAVDFEPSKALAAWWYANYKSRTKELISPYQQYNIHNGQRHRYTGAVWNQHNFAGGNAHDHIAMAAGGTINEPIAGVGASGRTYSFGENWQGERLGVTPNWQPSGGSSSAGSAVYQVTVVNQGVIGSKAEAEAFLVGALDDLKRRGRL